MRLFLSGSTGSTYRDVPRLSRAFRASFCAVSVFSAIPPAFRFYFSYVPQGICNLGSLSLSLSRARARARVLRRRCERVHSMREKKSDLGRIFLLSLSFGIRVSAHLYFFIQIRVAIASLSPLPPRIYPA